VVLQCGAGAWLNGLASEDQRRLTGSGIAHQRRRRRWAAFNCASFVDELNKSQLLCNPPTDVDELFDCYNHTIGSILDRLAPFADIKPYGKTVSPWYNRECYVTKLKTCRRHLSQPALTLWHTYTHRVQCTTVTQIGWFFSASLYVSKRGAYLDRLCRDVVGRWLSRTCTVAKRCILGL